MTSAIRTIASTAQGLEVIWRFWAVAVVIYSPSDLGDAPDRKRWRQQLEELLTRARQAMDRHPGIARVPLANVPTGPNAIRASERLLSLLRAGGVDDRSAAWFVDVVSLYINAASF